MPTVPTLTGPRVAAGNLPSARVVAETPGNTAIAAGRLAKKAGKDMGDDVLEMQANADHVAANQADNNMADFETELMHGKGGVLNQQGENAFGASAPSLEAYDAKVRETAEGLREGQQRDEFLLRADKRRTGLNRSLQNHIAGEIFKHEGAVFAASVDKAREGAVNNFKDPERVADEIKNQVDQIDAFGKSRGLPKEVVDTMKRDAISNTHLGVLQRMANAGDRHAMGEYLKKHRAEIDPDKIDSVTELHETVDLRGQAQEETDRIMALSGGDTKAALAQAREIEDSKLRDEVVGRVKNRTAEEKAIQAGIDNDRLLKYSSMMEQGRPLSSIPSDDWYAMTAQDRALLKAVSKSVAPNALGAQLGRALEVEAWTEFIRTDMEDLAGISLADLHRKYKTKVSDTTWQKMVRDHKLAQDAVGGGDGAAGNFSSNRSFGQLFDDTIRLSGLVPANKPESDWGDADKAEYLRLKDRADRDIGALEADQGRRATPEQKRDIVDKLMIEAAIPLTVTDQEPGLFDTITFRDLQTTVGEIPSQFVTGRGMIENEVFVPIDKIDAAEVNMIRSTGFDFGKKLTDIEIGRIKAAKILGRRDIVNEIVLGAK